MTTRRAPLIWKATSMPAVPPSTMRTVSGTPSSHNLRIRTGPTASSPRRMLPHPTTSTSHGVGANPSSSSACRCVSAVIAGSDHPVDDELAELPARLAVIGVDGADQARVEAAGHVAQLHRVLLVDDRRADQGLLDGSEHLLAVAWPDVPRRRGDHLVVGDLPVLDHDPVRQGA